MLEPDAMQREPWRSLPALGMFYLRHRIAGYTVAQIASAYGRSADQVRWHLKQVLRELRRRSNLRLPDVARVMVVAVQHGVRGAELPSPGDTNSVADGAAACPDAALVG